MKICITGVAGFIGSNLLKELLSRGHSVVGVDNFSYGLERNIEPFMSNDKFEFIEGDIADYDLLSGIECDILVHLASQKIPRYSNSLRTLEENAAMTNNVIKKCVSDNIRLVFASTSDIYGKNTTMPFNEESNSVLGSTTVKRWSYAVSKIFSEHKIIAYSEDQGLQYTIMRFFGSYGENQNLTWWGGPQSVFMEKAFLNEEIEVHGDGKQTRTFTYVKDTVQGIVKCIEMPEAVNEIFNIASEPENEITIKGLAELIWEMVRPGEQPKIKMIPYSTFGKYEDVARRVPDIGKIKDKLGFKPQYDLHSGLKITMDWQKQFHS